MQSWQKKTNSNNFFAIYLLNRRWYRRENNNGKDHWLPKSLLFYYMTQAENLFIDANFSVAPRPIYQCLVVMIFDKTLQIYVLILCVLMINKSQKKFRNAREWVFKISGRCINPKTTPCDFDLALINVIRGIFPYAKINGCLFHWKQTIWRELISLFHLWNY